MDRIRIETNEINEAVKSFEFVLDRIRLIKEDVYQWRWIIVGLHAGMQAIMTAAYKDTMGYNILKKNIRSKLLDALYDDKTLPKEHLDYFLELYNNVKSDGMLRRFHSRKLVTSEEQDGNVEKLNHYRNEFTHFMPRFWTLRVHDFPKMALHCIDIAEFLAFTSNNISYYNENDS